MGNLKLYVTNTHMGYAGPKFPHASHVNFHVDKKVGRKYVSVANFHITKYKRGQAVCLYVWESNNRKTVFDNCSDDWLKAAEGAVNAIAHVSRTLLSNADFFAFLVIVGILGALILAIPAGAVAFAEIPAGSGTVGGSISGRGVSVCGM